MANKNVDSSKLIHGIDSQSLIEKITRTRIYESVYWKDQCFALNAATLCDRAVDLHCIGGTISGAVRPSEFLCLALKLLQLQPEREIIMEYIQNKDFKYLTALGALYIRLTAAPADVYQLLEPLLQDYRKLCRQTESGDYCLSFMDEFADELLTEDRVCSIALPRLPNRQVLEQMELLEPRSSFLADEISDWSQDS